MSQEKIISFYGTIEDQLVDRIAQRLSERLGDFKTTPAIDEKKPLCINEASQFLDLAKQTLYKLTSEGIIPFHKQGGKLWFFRDELLAWIRGEQPAQNKSNVR
jgi:excisionase family DNA binding protein